MITRPRATKKKEARTLLICDGRRCVEVEEFPRATTPYEIAKWCKRNDWKVIHRGGHLFDHRCAHCARNLMAPPAYFERLQA